MDLHGEANMSNSVPSSGDRRSWDSGAVRDSASGKIRPDLIPTKALVRWGKRMGDGAEHYGARNWEQGIPSSCFLESAWRHLVQWSDGDRTEDHLAAVLFNIGAIIFNEGGEYDDIDEDDGADMEDPQLSVYFFEPPATFVDSHGDRQFVDVNTRIAQLTLPGFPSPDEAGAEPKVM